MRPVEVPTVRAGQDARLLAAQALGATAAANDRLKRSRTWYEQVRECYAEPAPKAVCQKESKP
jgi:hypothetical protein